jgi:3-oxoacyl-[acyl-carrier-protein] synthase II
MERVVVTGIGLVTPLGTETESTWAGAVAGRSGIGPITLFDATDEYPTRIAGEVKGFEATRYVEKKRLKEYSRFIPFAIAAAKMAVADANLELTDEARDHIGVFVGVGMGGLETLEHVIQVLAAKGPRRLSPYTIPSLVANMAAGQVSIELGCRGPSLAHTSACASSTHSLGEALRWIQQGKADVILAGGAEAAVWPIGIAGFSAMRALSRRNDEPERASRPWDRDRDGFVCSEGAGVLVLESATHARQRSARVLCELRGYAATSDAYHITKPAPDGEGAVRAMRLALHDARLNASDLDYVNGHATGTLTGDIAEACAIAKVFGSHAKEHKLWISSSKSMLGHLLGAAGAVEAALCVNTIRTGIVTPTINLDHPDAQCNLEFVRHNARERRVQHAISNSFGFGGTNASLILSAWEG